MLVNTCFYDQATRLPRLRPLKKHALFWQQFARVRPSSLEFAQTRHRTVQLVAKRVVVASLIDWHHRRQRANYFCYLIEIELQRQKPESTTILLFIYPQFRAAIGSQQVGVIYCPLFKASIQHEYTITRDRESFSQQPIARQQGVLTKKRRI